MLKRLLIFISLIILVFTSGCMSGDEKAVRQTITKYNENLMLALRRPQPELMANITTPRENNRIASYILYYYQQNKLLNCQLKKLDIKGVEIQEQKALARTQEQWVYSHLDLKSKKVVKPDQIVNYQATYRLEKVKDKWIVSSLEVKDDR